MNSNEIQMNNYLLNIIPRVEEVNNILSRPQSSEEVTLTDGQKLSSFFADFQDTNKLIDEAERMAAEDIGELQRITSTLSSALNPILSANLSIWEDVNFEEIVNSHLQPFDEVYKEAKAVSTNLWQVYQAMSNRLDYLHFDTDEYHQLDKECETAKKAYEKAHIITNKLYDSLRHEQSLCSDVFYFKILFVTTLIAKIKQIVDSAARDIDGLRKEGGI